MSAHMIGLLNVSARAHHIGAVYVVDIESLLDMSEHDYMT